MTGKAFSAESCVGTKGDFYCVNCGQVLDQRHCKLRCSRCGYFEDCSDGGNDPTNFQRFNNEKQSP